MDLCIAMREIIVVPDAIEISKDPVVSFNKTSSDVC
jgi:hypothetical protein